MTRVSSGDSSMGQVRSQTPARSSRTPSRTERSMPQPTRRNRSALSTDILAGTSEDRPIRHDLVRQVKAQISAGVYDSPAKLEAASDRLAGILDLLA